MRDRRFAIAVAIIIVLALALVYLTIIGPQLQGYMVNKQVQAQQVVIQAIMQQADEQGYVQLFDGNDSVILVKYNPEQSQQEPITQTTE